MPSISLTNVTKRYGEVTAVDAVSLSVSEPGLHCLVGPNGSGKTTVFRLMASLTRPDRGTVHHDNGRIGVGFQEPTFYPSYTVAENLEIFDELVAGDRRWRDQLVDRLALKDVLNRQAGALSGGFENRLDLALAFLGAPPIVLLDEPLGDLDEVARESVVSFLDAYTKGEVMDEFDDHDHPPRSVVVATHRLSAFADVLDRLTVIDNGTIVLDAHPETLETEPLAAYRGRVTD